MKWKALNSTTITTVITRQMICYRQIRFILCEQIGAFLSRAPCANIKVTMNEWSIQNECGRPINALCVCAVVVAAELYVQLYGFNSYLYKLWPYQCKLKGN